MLQHPGTEEAAGGAQQEEDREAVGRERRGATGPRASSVGIQT
jgi:hypothetical protein